MGILGKEWDGWGKNQDFCSECVTYEVPARHHHRDVELNEEVSARDKNLGISYILMIFEAMK